jgi:hypothetical protein
MYTCSITRVNIFVLLSNPTLVCFNSFRTRLERVSYVLKIFI